MFTAVTFCLLGVFLVVMLVWMVLDRAIQEREIRKSINKLHQTKAARREQIKS